jgi:hypothetical protein
MTILREIDAVLVALGTPSHSLYYATFTREHGMDNTERPVSTVLVVRLYDQYFAYFHL